MLLRNLLTRCCSQTRPWVSRQRTAFELARALTWALTGSVCISYIYDRERTCIHAQTAHALPTPRPDFTFEKDIGEFEKDYEFLEVIGEGGFAEIWKVRHKLTGMVRAAKIVELKTEHEYAVFLNEVDVLKRLDSPYNVRILGSFVSEAVRRPFKSECPRKGIIVYHYIHGLDLLDTINKRIALKESFSEQEIVSVTKQILKAICYVHNSGFVHRDIKPENFIVEVDDSPCGFNLKLIDFGLSRQMDQLTQTERTSGTWFYAAPETAYNLYTQKSDVWSAGVIITMIASQGSALIGRSTSMGIAAVRRIRDPDFVAAEVEKLAKRGISEELISLLKRMLDPNMETRISPNDALSHTALTSGSSLDYSLHSEALARWHEARKRYNSLPIFGKIMRLLYVHEMDDSEFPRLRYLFRILDKQAESTIFEKSLEDSVKTRMGIGYEEFLAMGLEDGEVTHRLDTFFILLSGGNKTLSFERFSHWLPTCSAEEVLQIWRSCAPERSRKVEGAMSMEDFRQCMLTEPT